MLSSPSREFATRLALIAAGFIFLTGPAASQQPTSAQRDAIRASCRSDYEAHCASISPGGEASLACLQKNMASLSQSCRQAVSAAVKPASSATSPTASDKPAAAATPAAPATAAAPKAVAPKATGAASTRQPSQAQVNAIRQACRSDYQAACAGVPPGGAAALNCLQKNAASLSQSCQQAVNAAGGSPAPSTSNTATTAPPASGSATTAAIAPGAMPLALTPRQEIFLIRTSCGEDFRSRCGGVRLGGGRVIACLRANAPSLSPTCQGALANLAR